MIKVKLLRTKISKDRHTLYLDFYPAIPNPKTGKPTRREFLKLYLYDKPHTPLERNENIETLKMAEMKRFQRYNDLNKPEIYTNVERDQLKQKEIGELSFTDYFNKEVSRRKADHNIWVSFSMHLQNFAGQDMKFSDITEKFCNDFRQYLLSAIVKRTKKPLSKNTAWEYFDKFKFVLKRAYNDGYLPTFLNPKLATISKNETRRNYLTMDELNQLAGTPCNDPVLKRAALFSALTGLRCCDIKKLTFQEVECANGNYSINFTQQKTGGVESLPISEQAATFLGKRTEPQNKPFENLQNSSKNNYRVSQWTKAAGITKNISFHCFRHTFATLQLTNGTDIYTISKMLGHRNLSTTQIYAKVIDKSKREAANRIKLDL
jgi:integrase